MPQTPPLSAAAERVMATVHEELRPKASFFLSQPPLHVDVRNLGRHDGDDVVQVYLTLSGTRPSLRAFTRIPVAAGATQPVRLELAARQLSHIADDGNRWMGEGRCTLHVGGGKPGTAAPSDIHGRL